MKKSIVWGAVVAVLLGAVGLVLWQGGDQTAGQPTAAAGKDEPLFYRHPMTPSITSPVPAKDNMGMDYIPVYAGDAGSKDDALVSISPVMVNNLGVRTEPVTRGPLAREIDTVGYVDFDERLLSYVNLRVEGWIEELQVRTRGAHVSEGDLLFKIYSPELETAQREYLQSVSGSATLRAAGAQRLRALGLNDAQIERLTKTRQVAPLVPIYAKQDGIVAELNAREGMFVTPGTTVMMLAGLDSVWVLVDIFEQHADWVKVGQKAEVRLPHKPNRVWTGDVEFIYPQLDPQTRTLKARLRFLNSEEALRPNMYAEVTVHADPRQRALSVPSEAVIHTGDGARVILAHGRGRFDPVPVATGFESGDRTEILDGLAEGDQVVVSAQFLIDSEASLQASLRRMTEPGEATEASVSEVIWAEGLVNSVATDPPTLNLSHEPIPELVWPTMTMAVAVADDVELAAVAPGQSLRFALTEGANGHVITAIDTAASADAGITGTGTLNRVDSATGKVNLSHAPLPALNWPAMTMDFALDEGMPPPAIEPGQAVRFQLEETDAGLVIVELDPAE